MFRLLYLLTSMLLLWMPLTDPKDKWLVGGVELHAYVFVFCCLAYIPLMVAAFVFFIQSSFAFFLERNLRRGSFLLAIAAMGGTALYAFNDWVFHDIF